MANKRLNQLTAAAAWTSTCSLVGSDSASPTDSFLWTKDKFDAVYGQLGAANVWTATNRFKTGGFNDMSIEFGAAVFGLCKYSGISGDGILSQMGNNQVGPAMSTRGFGMTNTQKLTWTASGDPMDVADTALGRTSAGIVEANNGTAGVLAEIQASNMVTKKVTGVDLKSVAVTDVFTIPAGKTFVLMDTYVVITSAAAATVGWAASLIESGAGAAIGGGATTAGTLNTNTAGQYYPHPRNAAASAVSFFAVTAGNKVQYSVVTGATATTLIGDVYVRGFYLS